MGNPRDAHGLILQELGDIACGRLTLDIGVGRQNDLLNVLRPNPFDEFLNPELIGAYSVHGGEHSAEDMVFAVILAHALHETDIARILDDAERFGIPFGVGADFAKLIFGIISADGAEMYPPLRFQD